ncbi:hypothetical protein NIES2135_04980 [Leptolyngbya boryana NIES-2135]|jgi:hypothetical protein|uniref:Actin-like protein N-terminal domain-containing protein n=1 Tax=Leptolyngbya boryana NIES-2135 TaxID=1973484 RepID=A0A1Z4JAJ1_LEPBY|nr:MULTISPECIES: hypothetical protein [Leptolyngbya]BAY53688.1 hypothetical protein NIES2135_04980 [Leptolyngbya boryana NIES-2135]MBD2367872.1 hypothetical protein [Leptolyngbya sp. FACHB-161]MBD2374280.1 hypothetical protein [Leptolyngbya sp. FACHB-238]MBD2398502.1 hypothetical protein [Leptolyngbya sp. FACHB-239]MBD2408316.1 hypothetical protein [Leptolyngbya sp. FACHB-402]
MNYSPDRAALSLRNKVGYSSKLISIEISNSQGKRYGEGDINPLIVHSAWTHTIDRVARGKGTQSSPQIQTKDGETIWFGEMPALGEHQSIATLGRDKSEMAAFLLMPLLLPEDNGGAHGGHLRIVMSHHSYFDPAVKQRIEDQILGRHQFTRNGREVDVIVDSVELVPEGVGAYWLASELNQLKSGYTLSIEIGYRTVEVWLLDDAGEPIKGEPIQFGVFNLASAISSDDEVRTALLGTTDTPKTVKDTQIAIALKQGKIAKIKDQQWEAIKTRHLERWKDDVIGMIFSQHEAILTQAEQILFSGGGAMLLRERLLKANPNFWVDSDAQTASVRGSYYHFLSLA